MPFLEQGGLHRYSAEREALWVSEDPLGGSLPFPSPGLKLKADAKMTLALVTLFPLVWEQPGLLQICS